MKIADATAEISKRSRGVERDWAGQLQTRAIRGVGRSTIGTSAAAGVGEGDQGHGGGQGVGEVKKGGEDIEPSDQQLLLYWVVASNRAAAVAAACRRPSGDKFAAF